MALFELTDLLLGSGPKRSPSDDVVIVSRGLTRLRSVPSIHPPSLTLWRTLGDRLDGAFLVWLPKNILDWFYMVCKL